MWDESDTKTGDATQSAQAKIAAASDLDLTEADRALGFHTEAEVLTRFLAIKHVHTDQDTGEIDHDTMGAHLHMEMEAASLALACRALMAGYSIDDARGVALRYARRLGQLIGSWEPPAEKVQ